MKLEDATWIVRTDYTNHDIVDEAEDVHAPRLENIVFLYKNKILYIYIYEVCLYTESIILYKHVVFLYKHTELCT